MQECVLCENYEETFLHSFCMQLIFISIVQLSKQLLGKFVNAIQTLQHCMNYIIKSRLLLSMGSYPYLIFRSKHTEIEVNQKQMCIPVLRLENGVSPSSVKFISREGCTSKFSTNFSHNIIFFCFAKFFEQKINFCKQQKQQYMGTIYVSSSSSSSSAS